MKIEDCYKNERVKRNQEKERRERERDNYLRFIEIFLFSLPLCLSISALSTLVCYHLLSSLTHLLILLHSPLRLFFSLLLFLHSLRFSFSLSSSFFIQICSYSLLYSPFFLFLSILFYLFSKYVSKLIIFFS